MIKARDQIQTNWRKVEERNSYSLVYCCQRNRYAEEYEITLSSQKSIQEWKERLKLKGNQIIEIIDSSILGIDGNVSPNNMVVGKIYLQQIAFRLSQIHNCEFDYQQQWLLQCLKGFQQLSGIYGYFNVKSSMIGITPQKKAKVWIQPNFLSNSNILIRQTQTQMVISIINLFKRVNIVFTQHHTTFTRIIDFLQSKSLKKIRSKSDIIYIDKLDFKDKKQTVKTQLSQTKSSFSDFQKVIGVRSSIKNAQQKRHSRLQYNSQISSNSKSINSQYDIISKITNPSIDTQQKLNLLDNILNQNSNNSLKRFCQIYKHALLNNQLQLLDQLQNSQGKLSNIKNIHILDKISSVLDNHNDYCYNKSISTSRINEILNKQRAKRIRYVFDDVKIDHEMCELKNQAERLLFD